MRPLHLYLSLALPLLAVASQSVVPKDSWQLLFADEFDYYDTSKWSAQLSNGCQYSPPNTYDMCGWGNGERQYYSDSLLNLRTRNGKLVITARKNGDGTFSSARIRTLGKFAVSPSNQHKTIRVQARIKLPRGEGLWGAFWMLPYDDPAKDCLGCGRYGYWPQSGEIDILEAANDMQSIQGSVHYGGVKPANKVDKGFKWLPDGKPLSDAYHVYGIEWEADQIRWYLDGELYHVFNSSGGRRGDNTGWYTDGANAGPNSPFDADFYLLLNLALGGTFTNYSSDDRIAATLSKPKRMMVDWVRVHGSTVSGKSLG